MKHFSLRWALPLLFLTASAMQSCKKDDEIAEEIVPAGKYENGFFLVNEGWFPRPGEIGFYDYASEGLLDSVFKAENPGVELVSSGSTMQYGAIYNDRLYIVAKVNGPVVVTDANTMKEVGRIAAGSGSDWRAFAGIDENTGLLSSSNGIYLVNLQSLTANMKLAASSGQVGDLLVAGKYIFAHSQSEGAVIYHLDDYSVAMKDSRVNMAFAKTPDGKVWYAKSDYLYSIDTDNLEKDSVALSFNANAAWGAWHSSSLVASTKENVVYILKTGAWGGGNEVYKYDGNTSSLQAPIITLPAQQEFYGKGIDFNDHLNRLVITTVQSGYGSNYAQNHLYFYEPNGQLAHSLFYEGYHFPAMPVMR